LSESNPRTEEDRPVFEDDYIRVALFDFNPHTGLALVSVDEKHENCFFHR
jgi:hypothetical protein